MLFTTELRAMLASNEIQTLSLTHQVAALLTTDLPAILPTGVPGIPD
jgi:hypothetical protein